MYFCPHLEILFLKNLFTYILFIIASLAYSYETIGYYSKTIVSDSIIWVDNFECEEDNSKSEGTADEDFNFTDDFYVNTKYPHNIIPHLLGFVNLGSRQYHSFPTSDYGIEVYSPPEVL